MDDVTCISKSLNVSLSLETCQEICLHGLNVFYAKVDKAKPESDRCDLPQLLGAVPFCGQDASLPNAATVKEIFSGVTTYSFQTIQSLYCHPDGRSIRTVCKILDLASERDGVRPLHQEAVTIICLYLEKRRQEAVGVSIRAREAEWHAGCFFLPFQVVAPGSKQFSPVIAYIVDVTRDEVLSFRVTDSAGSAIAASLALYDAIAAERQPSADARDGLVWSLPRRFTLSQEEFLTPVARTCGSLAIIPELLPTAAGDESSKTVAEWRMRWYGAVNESQPPLPLDLLELRLDNTLFRLQGYGPKRLKIEKLRDLSALRGYSRDPAHVFPEIRRLLPVFPGRIEKGAVYYDGLHYAAELLELWPDCTVQIRRSAESEARAWIYLDGDILCEASAVELRRRDGTYRRHR